MKTTSIRIRISESDKRKIETYANRLNKPVSEILRQAAAAAICGEIPGERARLASAAIRRSANQLLDILETKPVDVIRFRTALLDLRNAARAVVRSR